MKMKIPLTPPVGNNNGYYNNGLDYGDHQHHQAVNNLINNSALHQPPPQLNDLGSPRLDPEDFSEYLWMENEEEFDKQVMQQLEEEALMEQCIEAMLEDEREALTSTVRATWSNGFDASDLCDDMSTLCVSLGADAVANSTLNPLAAEFVPAPITTAAVTASPSAPAASLMTPPPAAPPAPPAVTANS
uniref:Putative polyadenylate-binding protein-interacting protein 2b n=1 Tax=Xenopsylla cheopis TaxID=163159 RepID=A0A6M2DMR7_XENCH